ncbi:MAG: hypothetical protein KDH95_19455 [Calditrichaeota bacterium]|nr:hypothetical protein [Calditrichota bacterium]MCB0270342.1 hypothetical protein [Calditrichota bacterium]
MHRAFSAAYWQQPQAAINVPCDQPTIQVGVDAASDGDMVLVAKGIYLEGINFKGKAITVTRHYFVDDDTSHISATIIDGSRQTRTVLLWSILFPVWAPTRC